MALDETERSAVQVIAYAAKVHSNLAASSLVARAQIINRQYSLLRKKTRRPALARQDNRAETLPPGP